MSHQMDAAWSNWFVGFCDGEGSFTYEITRNKSRPVKPSFKLTVQDDHELIREINSTLFGGGYVSLNKKVKALRHDGSEYANRSEIKVVDKERLSRLVAFFDVSPLRSHKQSEFLIWREMVFLYCNPPSRYDTLRMMRLAMDLSQGRVSGMAKRGRAKLEILLEEWENETESD